MNTVQQDSFFRVPPFPGARPVAFVVQRPGVDSLEEPDAARLMSIVRELKIGGEYWAAQPEMPSEPYTLIRVGDTAERARILAGLQPAESLVCWTDAAPRLRQSNGVAYVSGACDPWHLVGGAKQVFVDADEELALVAAIAGVPVCCIGNGAFSCLERNEDLLRAFRIRVSEGISYRSPFTGAPISVEAALRLCGFWRELIDSNRDIAAAVGFAFWKRPTVAALLWNGSNVNFVSRALDRRISGKVAVWKARTPGAVLSELEQAGNELIEVEDGFIRSAGLGADCVPPLSIVVDRLGAHFDPARESELERLIQHAKFPTELIERARILRELIVSSGISKYAVGSTPPLVRISGRRHVLVPGQVEDDRAVLCGSGDVEGNLDLLRRVRRDKPDAFIVYKPHPDVEAGHRLGGVVDDLCLEFADEIVRDQPISTLISFADEVHVNSSLAGFEALLREKPVTTHGVPFYAGWGLTRDLGPVPGRRTEKRSIDELVAAVLLQYPRYLDPLTGLPCPPEVLVRRLVEGSSEPRNGLVVQMRRLQGRMKKRIAGLAAR